MAEPLLDCQVAVSALILRTRTVPSVSVYGLDHHFLDQWLDVVGCYLIFLPLVVSVSRSVWWFKNGNWCFVLVPCYFGPSCVDCMLNEGVCMHPSLSGFGLL